MKNSESEILVRPGGRPGEFLHDGKPISPPPGWKFVPAGDPGLTRRIKMSGEFQVLVHQRRNRLESIGLWCPAELADRIAAELETERNTPEYRRKMESARRSRCRKQQEYATEFRQAVLDFLAFAPACSGMAEAIADAVTAHAVPVGSGTVARTARIPLERRAEAAVIAWMRHQTTAYDRMTIPRVKGERREVRRMLAERSRKLLDRYRAGNPVDPEICPLAAAVAAIKKLPSGT